MTVMELSARSGDGVENWLNTLEVRSAEKTQNAPRFVTKPDALCV